MGETPKDEEEERDGDKKGVAGKTQFFEVEFDPETNVPLVPAASGPYGMVRHGHEAMFELAPDQEPFLSEDITGAAALRVERDVFRVVNEALPATSTGSPRSELEREIRVQCQVLREALDDLSVQNINSLESRVRAFMERPIEAGIEKRTIQMARLCALEIVAKDVREHVIAEKILAFKMPTNDLENKINLKLKALEEKKAAVAVIIASHPELMKVLLEEYFLVHPQNFLSWMKGWCRFTWVQSAKVTDPKRHDEEKARIKHEKDALILEILPAAALPKIPIIELELDRGKIPKTFDSTHFRLYRQPVPTVEDKEDSPSEREDFWKWVQHQGNIPEVLNLPDLVQGKVSLIAKARKLRICSDVLIAVERAAHERKLRALGRPSPR